MEAYDYNEAVYEDILQYIDTNIFFEDWKGRRQELEDKLNDDLWAEDSVTGNGPDGGYASSEWEAEEYLCHNLDLLGEALFEFGCGMDYLKDKGAIACDATIRCYLLSSTLTRALDRYELDGFFDEAED